MSEGDDEAEEAELIGGRVGVEAEEEDLVADEGDDCGAGDIPNDVVGGEREWFGNGQNRDYKEEEVVKF